jgi:nucleotide-binding universal stress UspA family protein
MKMSTQNLAADGPKRNASPTRLSSVGELGGAETPAPSLSRLCLRTIVAPFDFSNASAALLHRLVALAGGSDLIVHLLHVVPPASGVGANTRTPIYPGVRVAAARRQIEEWVAKTFPRRVAITTTVRVGRAADEIVAHAQALSADMIVMSAHVGSSGKNALLRTTTERVVRQSPCPVLVVARDHVEAFMRAPDEFPFRGCRRILVPVDLSGDARQALAYASMIARENDAKLHLLHCRDKSNPEPHGAASTPEERLTAWLGSQLRWPVKYEATVWSNVPLLNAILQEINLSKIDLVVLPARAGVWFRRHRLWSITDGILRHAPCPVLSVNARVTPSAFGTGSFSITKTNAK